MLSPHFISFFINLFFVSFFIFFHFSCFVRCFSPFSIFENVFIFFIFFVFVFCICVFVLVFLRAVFRILLFFSFFSFLHFSFFSIFLVFCLLFFSIYFFRATCSSSSLPALSSPPRPQSGALESHPKEYQDRFPWTPSTDPKHRMSSVLRASLLCAGCACCAQCASV